MRNVFHGGKEIERIENKPLFTTTSKEAAMDYATGQSLQEFAIAPDAKVKTIDANGQTWREMKDDFMASNDPIREHAERAREEGYDVLEVKNVMDPSCNYHTLKPNLKEGTTIDEFIVLNPEVATKVSSEPVAENYKKDLLTWVEEADPFAVFMPQKMKDEYKGKNVEDYFETKTNDPRIEAAVKAYMEAMK